MYYKKVLYIFFLILALNLSFFSTSKVNAKAFLIDEIEISEKLENNFNKDILINKGFKKAFKELMGKLVQSKDLKKTIFAISKDIKLFKRSNNLVLLSPSAASFDQFDNFEKRGNEFKRLCRTYVKKFIGIVSPRSVFLFIYAINN